jgi:hypothetical protein
MAIYIKLAIVLTFGGDCTLSRSFDHTVCLRCRDRKSFHGSFPLSLCANGTYLYQHTGFATVAMYLEKNGAKVFAVINSEITCFTRLCLREVRKFSKDSGFQDLCEDVEVQLGFLKCLFCFPLHIRDLDQIYLPYRIRGISRCIGCPTMLNNRLDPTSTLLQSYLHQIVYTSVAPSRRTINKPSSNRMHS